MMNTLIVGIDISSGANDLCALTGDGARVVPHHRVANNQIGFEAMLSWLANLVRTLHVDRLVIGGEATGMLWFHTFWQLQQVSDIGGIAPEVYILNAHEVSRFRKMLRDRDKTDPKDAYVIAEWLRFGHLPHPLRLDIRYLPLQRLTRQRFRLMQALAREKIYTRQIALHLKMNTYGTGKPFARPFAKTGRWALTHYESLEALLDEDLATLAAAFDLESKGRIADAEAVAAEFQTLAAAAYPLDDALLGPINFILDSQLTLIDHLTGQIALLDARIGALAAGLPGYAHLRSIPGIGPVFAAGLLSELQDISRFTIASDGKPRERFAAQAAVAKFAGLWWPRSQSGNFEAEERPMAKNGNRYLRYYLIEAANCVRLQEPDFKAFYLRKHAEATRHQHHRALVLTARKLARLVSALLLEDRAYQSRGGLLVA